MNIKYIELIALQSRLRHHMKIYRWSDKTKLVDEEHLVTNKIPYYFLNAVRIVTSGFIKTIDGDYEVNVIGMRELVKKTKIFEEIKKVLERKRKKNLTIVVLQFANIPYEIANKIINFAHK